MCIRLTGFFFSTTVLTYRPQVVELELKAERFVISNIKREREVDPDVFTHLSSDTFGFLHRAFVVSLSQRASLNVPLTTNYHSWTASVY